MAKILSSTLLGFVNIATRNKVRDDDVVDQLNHWATVGLLTGLAMATGAKQFVGVPIRCWLPAEYKKGMYLKYANNYCWISQMYYVPFSDPIAFNEEDRWEVDISFYRWVTVMFLLQALLFKLPNLIWKELKGYSGLNVAKVVAIAQETSLLTPEKRQEKLAHAAIFMHRWLETYSQYKYNALVQFREKLSRVFFCFGKRTGTYLIGLYMFVKILYVANIFGQFFLLSSFLGLNYWNFGADALSVLSQTGRWQDHYTFPRIGMCDYKIRQMANVQTFSVQCVLSVNLFLEKMYLLLWFWMIGLLAANVISLFLWVLDDLLPARNQRFLLRYIKMMGIDDHDKATVDRFIHKYLRRDGVFILRMVAKNTSSLLCLELVKELWKCFTDDLTKRGRPNGLPRQPSAPAEEPTSLDEVDAGALPEKPPLE